MTSRMQGVLCEGLAKTNLEAAPFDAAMAASDIVTVQTSTDDCTVHCCAHGISCYAAFEAHLPHAAPRQRDVTYPFLLFLGFTRSNEILAIDMTSKCVFALFSARITAVYGVSFAP